YGTWKRGCTAANQPGRSRLRAIARLVRPIPAIIASRAPRAAAAAPIRITIPGQSAPVVSATALSGAAADASPVGPSAWRAETATSAYTTSVIVRAVVI